MPITIEEVNDSVHCVKWWINFGNTVTSGKTNKTIQFARFFAYFDIACSYSEINSEDRSYSVELSLKQLGMTGSNSIGNRETIPDYYREPFAVSIVSKKDHQQHMFERESDGWKINTTLKKSSASHILAIIYIQFHSFIEISDLLKHLIAIYVNQSNCDIHFNFKDGQKIGGHFSILAARSSVFAAMFNHETMQEKKTREVFIEDIQLNIFKELLHYIYCGRTGTIMTGDTARLMLVAADKYDVPGLKEECIRILLIHLQESNAFELLIWAEQNSVEKVKEGTLNYVARNLKTICQMEDWESFILNYPQLSLLITRHFGSIN